MINQINESTALFYAVTSAGAIVLLIKMKARLGLSLAKHRSLAGHPRIAKTISAFLPNYVYDEKQVFRLDNASKEIGAIRQKSFGKILEIFQSRYPKTLSASSNIADSLSDLQFVSAYRLPFQFRPLIKQGLKIGSFYSSAEGVMLTDLDGNQFYDLTGSYGVNVFGIDFYKQCIEEGGQLVNALGPLLGGYHPVLIDNVNRLKQISGMDEISFHMSGTEAVMQAVRLARYHTRKNKIVRFCGAYHGWWGDVQPGIGNPIVARDTLTLTEMSHRTLKILASRTDIACVLVNPLQALHPNVAAPSDSSLLDSSRKAGFSRAAYTLWLKQVKSICEQKGIAFILDEVFVGFRLGLGGAQEYFDIKADIVTYGKTLGGGLPIGVVCGKKTWMKRFDESSPADICFARGTFNSHPYVMGAMNVFLKRLHTEDIQTIYASLEETWQSRADQLNQQLVATNIPVQVKNMSSIWTVVYTQHSSYNWLFQYYLRLEGLALSWVGSGRIIFSLNYTDADFSQVCERFILAGKKMKEDQWWPESNTTTNQQIKRRILKEMLRAKFK